MTAPQPSDHSPSDRIAAWWAAHALLVVVVLVLAAGLWLGVLLLLPLSRPPSTPH